MRLKITSTDATLWLSAHDTYAWAHRANSSWPCSRLSGHRAVVTLSRGNLVDLTVDGKYGDSLDIPGDEFDAIVEDHLRDRLPKDHPCYPDTLTPAN